MAILNPKDEQVIGDEGDVQYQARKPHEDEEYPTDGVHWAFNTFAFSKNDARFVWETIANISKRNYNGFAKTINGEYIADYGNKLFF